MIKTFKVMLIPNNKQQTKLYECAGYARFSYNWALDYEQFNYEIGNDFLSDYELRKVFTQLKKDRFQWANAYSNNIAKQAIKDAVTAYKNFFESRAGYPNFKSKKKSRPGFYVDPCKIKFTDTHVKLEKLTTSRKDSKQKFNLVRLAEHGRIPIHAKYSNPRVTFDGLHWWISVGVEEDDCTGTPTGEGIGIDLGVKALAACSDGAVYANINKSRKVKQLEKRKRRLQRRVSRKYHMNKEGNRYRKTCNIVKGEKQLLVLNRRLTHIRHDFLHQTTTEIVNRQPRFIVMEDLNVSGMMQNKNLSKAVQQQCFHEFYRQTQYKCVWNNIKFITADRWFPSSKICCVCGEKKSDLKLSERIFVCPSCGNSIDRDFQASVNLRMYGEKLA